MTVSAGKQRISHWGSGLICTFLILGCAKSLPPPGGPIDKTPPQISATQPVTGAVKVPLDTRIAIEFSEPIDRNSVARSLFLSPQPDPEPKIKIMGNTILIVPHENLKPDKTYVITVGTDLKDAHSVNLDQSFSLAFSTGESIDSGSISGTVYRKGKGVTGMNLALFEHDPGDAGLLVDSLAPDYVTQSGEGGLFAFEYLPPGEYYLVAFEDKNKNHRINPDGEMIGLPYAATVIDSGRQAIGTVGIQLHAFDTTSLGLRSVSVNPDRLLKVRFSRPLDSVQAGQLIALASLVLADDISQATAITGYTNISAYPSADYILLTDPLASDRQYVLSFDLRSLYPQIDDSLRLLSYGFNVIGGVDALPPILLATVPDDKAVNVNPRATFVFQFSEPIDTTGLSGFFRIASDPADTGAVSITARDRFVYEGSPLDPLSFGRGYRLLIDADNIRDRAGNVMSDSLIAVGFTTIGLDTLGQLSGEIRFSDPAHAAFPVIVSFHPTGQGTAEQISLNPGLQQFVISLLPGYYTLSAYLDVNANGEYDYGSIIPYRLAEPFTVPADTFRVRTRFESGGVILEL